MNWGIGSLTFLDLAAGKVRLTGAGIFYGTFQFTGALRGHVGVDPNQPCDIALTPLTGAGAYAIVMKEFPDSNFGTLLFADWIAAAEALTIAKGNYAEANGSRI